MEKKSKYMELLRGYFLTTAKQYGVTRMALFGSVARNEQTEGSDVDVAYEGKPDLLLRCKIKRELEELFSCDVDVVRLRPQLSDTLFGKNIAKDLAYV